MHSSRALLQHRLHIVIVQTLLLTSILLASYREAESPVLPERKETPGNTLGNWYNLGRVSGNRTYLNMLSPYIDRSKSGFLLADFFHTTWGSDHLEGGLSFVSGIGFNRYNFIFLGMLPEGNLLFAPTPGNRISLTMTTPSLSLFLSEQFSGSGLEDGFSLNSMLRWTFLSHNGEIEVNPDQYETAFCLGPQVNAGQVKTSLIFGNPSGVSEYSYHRGIFVLYSTATVGILDNLAITGRYSFASDRAGIADLSHFNTLFSPDPINSYTGTLPYLYPLNHSASGFLEYRLPMFDTKGGYQFTRGLPNESIYGSPSVKSHTFFLDASYLLGTHISSLSEVNGNFDGYFTPIPGGRQLYVHAYSVFDFTSNLYLQSYQTLQLQNDIRYGATPFLTLGQHGSYLFREDDSRIKEISLTFTLSNIPLRTRGPESVSKFEYQFGYWPRAGEFRVDGSYRLPLNKNSNNGIYTPGSVLEQLSNSNYQNPYSFITTPSPVTFSQQRGNTGPLSAPDIALSFATGLSNTTFISNTIAFRTDDISGSNYWDGYRTYTGTTNHLWADKVSIHLGNPEQYLHSSSILLAGQTDSRARDIDKFDFLFSYTYTAGF